MKRLSEYMKEAEDWVEKVFATKLLPPVRIVGIVDKAGCIDYYSNDPFVEITMIESVDQTPAAKLKTAACPFPINKTYC